MLDTIERTEAATTTELPSDTAAKRALIESELRKDAGRSDREIARVVGCDHKTVGAHRERLGLASPLGNLPPSHAPEYEKIVDAAVDQCRGAILRKREERKTEIDAEGEKNQELTLLPPREEVTIQHDVVRGQWIIRQRRWPDEDGVIIVSDEDIHPFVDILTDHLGYGRAP